MRAELIGRLDADLRAANADRIAQVQAITSLEARLHDAQRAAAGTHEAAAHAEAQLASVRETTALDAA